MSPGSLPRRAPLYNISFAPVVDRPMHNYFALTDPIRGLDITRSAMFTQVPSGPLCPRGIGCGSSERSSDACQLSTGSSCSSDRDCVGGALLGPNLRSDHGISH